MDPLFKAYGTERYRERDPEIRLAEERDVAAFAELFRLNYGEKYLAPDVYNGIWVKRSIHSDEIFCLVLEQDGMVLATGSVILSFGDRNDRSGELARLAVHPDYSDSGLGKRLVEALFDVAENSLEFAFVEGRTAHKISQILVERAAFRHIGFATQLLSLKGRRESIALYGKLHDNGLFLRSPRLPSLIPEAVPLANFVLAEMGLSSDLTISDTPLHAAEVPSYAVRPLDRAAVGPLLRIPNGRLVDPLLFGNTSIEQGFTAIRDKARYLVAFDDANKPVGTIGIQYDETSRILKGIELIAPDESVWPSLCRELIDTGDELGAEVMTMDVSAYQPQLQRLLFDRGFRPVAYAPAMVFHATERLDVIKMLKLNVPYNPGEMSLTEKSKEMFSLVQANFV